MWEIWVMHISRTFQEAWEPWIVVSKFAKKFCEYRKTQYNVTGEVQSIKPHSCRGNSYWAWYSKLANTYPLVVAVATLKTMRDFAKLCKVNQSGVKRDPSWRWNSGLWKTWKVLLAVNVRHEVVGGRRLMSRRDSLLLLSARPTAATSTRVTVRVGKRDWDLNNGFLSSARLLILNTQNIKNRFHTVDAYQYASLV